MIYDTWNYSDGGRDEMTVNEYNNMHEKLDSWLLPHKKWTVELLLVIMSLVGKSFNCTQYVTECTSLCLEGDQITFDVARILVAAIMPSNPCMKIEDSFIDHSSYESKLQRRLDPGNIICELATKGIDTLDDTNETSAGERFHQISLEGISPLIQNLLLPMGLQTEGDKLIFCPFVVGAFNNRNMVGVLQDGITETLFSETPRFNFADQYNTTMVAKTCFEDRIADSSSLCKLQVYDASEKNRELVGSVRGYSQELHGGVILPSNDHHQLELECLFQLIGKTSNTQSKIVVDVADVAYDLHHLYSIFKVELEIQFREQLSLIKNPVNALKELAMTIKNNSGSLLEDFFPKLSTINTESVRQSPLPLIVRLCKLLLQGQSALVDQLLEGNHRQACISESIGNSVSTPNGNLLLHLLFHDSKVVQIIPAHLEDKKKRTMQKVSPIFMAISKVLFNPIFLVGPNKKIMTTFE
jgi:hypothetical protein